VKRNTKTKKLVVTALMAAISAVLMHLEFSIPIFPSFLRFDFSNLPALIVAFGLGPVWGMAVVLIKDLVHLLSTYSGGIGEFADFMASACLVLPAGLFYRKNRTRGSALLGMGVGMLLSAAVSAVLNYYVLIPFYEQFMPLEEIIAASAQVIPAIDSLMDVILLGIVPFNLFKCFVLSAVTALLYKRISVLLK